MSVELLFSHSVLSDSLQPHGLQHARQASLSFTIFQSLLKLMSIEWVMPSGNVGNVGNSTISTSVIPFSSCLLFFLASGSFPMSQFFTSGGQSIGASTSESVLPINIQD